MSNKLKKEDFNVVSPTEFAEFINHVHEQKISHTQGKNILKEFVDIKTKKILEKSKNATLIVIELVSEVFSKNILDILVVKASKDKEYIEKVKSHLADRLKEKMKLEEIKLEDGLPISNSRDFIDIYWEDEDFINNIKQHANT